jgi:very-short-patch-repair endonuclease
VLGYWQYVPPGRFAAARHDARRTAWLAERGYRVIRFRNHEVDEDVERVVETIRQALK